MVGPHSANLFLDKRQQVQDRFHPVVGRSGIWHSSRGAYLVTVTGYLGIGSDDREYVRVPFIRNGIALDEIDFSESDRPEQSR